MKPVNLLPENLRPRAHREGSGGAYLVLGTLGALLVAVLLYVVTTNQVTTRESETQELRAEADAAEERAGALARFGEFQKMKETRVASVSTLAAGRFDWERMARELALVLPTGVWLTELKATATGEEAPSGGGSSSGSSSSSSGSSSSSSSGGGTPGEQGPGLTLLGCAPSQQAVAETMVRLRRVHQAQEVSLTSSERDQEEGSGASAAPAPSAGAGAASPAPSGAAGGASGAAAVEGCGTKRGRSNYKFEVKVTLVPTPDPTVGGRSVPRSLGGGS